MDIKSEDIRFIAMNIYKKIMSRINLNEEFDVPSYVAWRLIGAIEWASPHYSFSPAITEEVCSNPIPAAAIKIIRKHFNI